MNTKFSQRSWILLWICLIVINVIMRIPVTPHEIGHDSFLISFIADSLSISGHAKWWLHSLSMIGLYPFSAASALHFYLSGVSQSLSLSMERTIWVVMLCLGIFSSFTAYLMAGAIKDDKLFKFITAFVYTTSPGILYLTTWSASGRGLFLVLLPLFIYLLLKSRFSKLKFSLLCFVLLILILATHNLFYITIPIFLSYLIVRASNNFQIKASNLFVGIISLILFITIYIQYAMAEVSVITLIKSFLRYIGVFGFFVIGGFLSLLLKNNKTSEEKFLLLILFFLLPALSILTYSKFFLLPFEALLISYGIMNLITISQKRNVAFFVIFILIAFSVGFAEYYQFSKISGEIEGDVATSWAEDSTVNAALWTRSYINKMVFTDEITLSRRILAYSGAKMFTENDIVYPIQDNLGTFNISMRSPFSRMFYGEGPFEVQNRTGLRSWAWYKLRNEGIDSKWNWILENIEIDYYIKNERFNSTFSRSFKERSKLYDVGKISIWDFNK